MKKTLAALAAILFLISCAHVSRKPSAADEINKCEAGFKKIEAVQGLDGMTTTVRMAKASIPYLRETMVPDLKRRIEALGTMERCQRNEEIVQLENQLNRVHDSLGDFAAQGPMVASMEKEVTKGPLFNDPNYADKFSCEVQCHIDHQADDKGDDKCVGTCGLHKARTSEGDNFGILRLASGCYVRSDDSPPRFLKSDFKQFYQTYFLNTRSDMLLAVSLFKDLKNSMKDSVAQIERLQAFLRKTKIPKPGKLDAKCEPPAKPAWADGLANNVPLIRTEVDTRGTAFFTKSNGRTWLSTAYHIYDKDQVLGFEQRNFDLVYAHGFKVRVEDPEKITITPTAGFIYHGLDAIHTPVDFDKPGLEVAAYSDAPKVGQDFYLAGFPATAYNELQVPACKFYGVVQSVRGAGSYYSFSCRIGADKLNGFSGGPVLDADGKVWAIVTNDTGSSDQVLASPIYRAQDGNVRSGIGHVEVSDACLDPDNWTRHVSCQLMPDQYETQIP